MKQGTRVIAFYFPNCPFPHHLQDTAKKEEVGCQLGWGFADEGLHDDGVCR